MARHMLTVFKSIVAACAAFAASAAIAQSTSSATSGQQWQAVATADLNAVRDIIQSTHPGAIDDQNPEFQHWTQIGYEQARALIARVTDYDSAMAAVRSYVTGFRDGHFTYSDNARKEHYAIASNGIGMALVDGRYLVTATLPAWSVPLPPVGAELLSCDGLTPQQIVEQRHAPYYSRRQTEGDAHVLASMLHTRAFSGDELKHCTYRTTDGKSLQQEIVYKSFLTKEYFYEVGPALRKGAPGSASPRDNRYTLKDGVLWIDTANFNPRPGTSQAADLDKMLIELAALTGVKQIVFDTRGNRGGDSRVGGRIFEAATGGLDYDKNDLSSLPRTFAQWRVSDVAVEAFASNIERMTKVYGADSNQARYAQEMHKRFQDAKAAGEQWVRQDADYRITPADIAARGGHLRRFKGTVALVTDHNCASACLDFADLVRSVPGSVHLGQTTSVDAVYIDGGGRVKLPSGNVLVLPLKVWRNRLRGNDEPWVPHVPLAVDMRDDGRVRQAVLNALGNPVQAKH
jgi:hypothetical protein